MEWLCVDGAQVRPLARLLTGGQFCSGTARERLLICPWRRRRPTASPGVAPRPGGWAAGCWHTAGAPGAQRPGAPGGAPRHAGHARPRACTPGGPCCPSPMAPAAPHGKPLGPAPVVDGNLAIEVLEPRRLAEAQELIVERRPRCRACRHRR